MKRTAMIYKAAIASALMLASSHIFAFDFTHMAMKTAEHAIFKDAKKFSEDLTSKQSTTVAAEGSIEVAFYPNEGAEALVVKVINSAQREIRILSYSFTSAPLPRPCFMQKNAA